ncbi:MAG: M48 family metallopeptidase [Deltaproteobacteria bacterium]|nr:M48 family metallopeptidase [Deltaproteobacteria bacterium]
MLRLFEMGPHRIEYRIQRTSRTGSVGIQVLPNSSVLLRIPKRFSEKKLDEIVEKRAAWILAKQNHFKENFKVYSLTQGAKLPYRGQSICLQIQQASIAQRSVSFNGTELIVLLREGDGIEPHLRAQLLKWYYAQAREKIIESIDRFQMDLGVSVKKISVRNQRQRWGSCNHKQHLSFNWRLILVPPQLLDYVVLHEMCHVLHPNHSRFFWETVESVMPNYAENRRGLRQKSAEYFSFL